MSDKLPAVLQLVTCSNSCNPPASSLQCSERCRPDILPPPAGMASVVWSAAPTPSSPPRAALSSTDAFLPETKATVRASNKSSPSPGFSLPYWKRGVAAPRLDIHCYTN